MVSGPTEAVLSVSASHCRSTRVAPLEMANWRAAGHVSPWSSELATASLARTSWSAKYRLPSFRLTASSLSPPPPVWHVGRLRWAHVKSYSRRNVLPPSRDRLSWLVLALEDRGQSTKIRFG